MFPVMAMVFAAFPSIGMIIGSDRSVTQFSAIGIIFTIMWAAEKIVETIKAKQ